MHGRIECWECGDIKAGCKCSQHEAAVIYETCDNCKKRLSSQSDSPFKTEKIEERVIGDSLIQETWLAPKE
jgi:hypothetical protein